MNIRTKSILKYFIEFLIVAFGVFLGMYVSEWRSQKRMNADKEKSVQYIFEELKGNKVALEEAIEYHALIKVGLDSVLATLSEEDMSMSYYQNKKFNKQGLKGWKGVGFASFNDTAFEGAKLSGTIQDMDIEIIQAISKYYKNQQVNIDFGKSVLDKLMSTESDTKLIDVIGNFELLTNDLLNHENWLLSQLDVTINEIRAINP